MNVRLHNVETNIKNRRCLDSSVDDANLNVNDLWLICHYFTHCLYQCREDNSAFEYGMSALMSLILCLSFIKKAGHS